MGVEELIVEGKKISFNPVGLTEPEQALVREVAVATIIGAKQRFQYALERCTFFGDYGRDALEEALAGRSEVANPHIEGDDENPFNQHYWVAFDLLRPEGSVPILVDPIFHYVGRRDQIGDVLSPEYTQYYGRARIVRPHKNRLEGGVRVNTIGI